MSDLLLSIYFNKITVSTSSLVDFDLCSRPVTFVILFELRALEVQLKSEQHTRNDFNAMELSRPKR